MPAFVGAHPDRPNDKYVDTMALAYPREGVEVSPYMRDGMIDNWDLFEAVLDHAFEKVLKSESEEHAVLFTEAPWNHKAKREQLTELMLEKYSVPAFFICKTAVLAAFANGRATGLVIDCGATHTSAVPVHDGYVLQQAVVKSPLGGDFLTMQCQQFLEEQTKGQGGIVPAYQVAGKEVGEPGTAPKWTKKPNLPEVTKSWHSYMVKQSVLDFQQTVLQVSDLPYDEETLSNIPTVDYEFPNGLGGEYGEERYRIAETLFNPTFYRGAGGQNMLNVAHACTTSVGMCDMDLRPQLYNNAIVTGGNSLLQGFSERLNRDLAQKAPSNMRFKLMSATGAAERRLGAWVS